jgi:tetratricopeptide (TPR) repeat protein
VRRRSALALALALVLALGAGSGTAAAQGYGAPEASPDAGKSDGQPEKKRTWGKRNKTKLGKAQTVRERTGKYLSAASELVQAEKVAEAEGELGKLRYGSLNSIERAKYHTIYGYLENARKQPDTARDHFEKALAEKVLSPEEEARLRSDIASILLGQAKWSEAVEQLKKFIELSETPKDTTYYLLALAYYQMDDLANARIAAERAIELGNPPQEGSLQLLLAIRLSNQEYAEAEPVLLELLQRYPKKVYWTQLSTLFGAQGDYEKALVYLELANLQGFLTEDEEVRRLTQLLLARDLPYPAAQLLEKAFEEKRIEADANAYELLSTAWIQARDFDKALPPLRKAAELSTDGKLYIRLAQVHLQREELDQAEAALRNAMDKGGLPSPGDAQLLMGIALFGQKRPEQALTWFGRAREHAATREEAEIWVKHVQQQLPTLAAAGATEASN